MIDEFCSKAELFILEYNIHVNDSFQWKTQLLKEIRQSFKQVVYLFIYVHNCRSIFFKDFILERKLHQYSYSLR